MELNQEFSVHTTLNELKALPSGIRQLSRLFAESRTRQSGLYMYINVMRDILSF